MPKLNLQLQYLKQLMLVKMGLMKYWLYYKKPVIPLEKSFFLQKSNSLEMAVQHLAGLHVVTFTTIFWMSGIGFLDQLTTYFDHALFGFFCSHQQISFNEKPRLICWQLLFTQGLRYNHGFAAKVVKQLCINNSDKENLGFYPRSITSKAFQIRTQ